MTQKTCLQEVDLGHNNLAGVNEDILASGVNLVHVVKLYDTNLTRYRISTTYKSPIFTDLNIHTISQQNPTNRPQTDLLTSVFGVILFWAKISFVTLWGPPFIIILCAFGDTNSCRMYILQAFVRHCAP